MNKKVFFRKSLSRKIDFFPDFRTRQSIRDWFSAQIQRASQRAGSKLPSCCNDRPAIVFDPINFQCNKPVLPCTCEIVASNAVHAAILNRAAEAHCDLIFMAAHGRHGNAAQLPGSEALKVLAHSNIPVLLHKS